jgi:hypothetical protein
MLLLLVLLLSLDGPNKCLVGKSSRGLCRANKQGIQPKCKREKPTTTPLEDVSESMLLIEEGWNVQLSELSEAN